MTVFAGLSEVLRKHTFVGMADETLALLQHGTRLYLLNVATLSKEMFYEQVRIRSLALQTWSDNWLSCKLPHHAW